MRFSEKTAQAKELQARQKNIDAHRPLYLNQHTFTSHLFFGPYVFFPIISALVWLGGILALLALWVKAGKPRYQPDEPYVVFISDTGAAHKTLFIIICCITSAFYILSLFAERWLRHVDRLPTDVRRREKVFDWIAIVFTIIGSAGLILLSIVSPTYSSLGAPTHPALCAPPVRRLQSLDGALGNDARLYRRRRHLGHLPVGRSLVVAQGSPGQASFVEECRVQVGRGWVGGGVW